jgi:hypothetical protein
MIKTVGFAGGFHFLIVSISYDQLLKRKRARRAF